jgi:hypothetical protein
LPLKRLAASAFFVFFVSFGASILAAEHSIYFKTSPRLELIRPLSEPAILSILVTAADGRPIQEGWVDIALEAPKPSRWFSTDFPLVEGSRLIAMRLDLVGGKAEWRYLFPIRGEYRVTVEFVTPDGKQASQVFNFNIREHRQKWLLLAGFTLGLFAFGFVAGRVFSRVRTDPKENMIGCLAVIIWLIASVGLGASTAGAQTSLIAGRLEIEPAVVGRPALVRWRLDGDGKPANSGAVLSLTITYLEKGTTVFAVEKLRVDKEFLLNFQFADAAEYRLRAVADVPGARAVDTEQIVPVAAVEPPARAIVAPMVLFLSALGAGLAAGRWSCRRAVGGRSPWR